MSTVFESLPLKGLRLAHLRQLQAYIDTRDESRWYYGMKEHFEQRHSEPVTKER